VRFLIGAMLAIGCGHAPSTAPETGTTHVQPVVVAPDAPRALEDDPHRLATLSTLMFQDIAKLLAAGSTDCAQVSGELDAIAKTYAEAIFANAKVLHGGHDKIQALKAALEPHQADLDTAAQTIGASPTMKTCSGDPAFAKAVDGLLGES
jgi:hypothetical protein